MGPMSYGNYSHMFMVVLMLMNMAPVMDPPAACQNRPPYWISLKQELAVAEKIAKKWYRRFSENIGFYS